MDSLFFVSFVLFCCFLHFGKVDGGDTGTGMNTNRISNFQIYTIQHKTEIYENCLKRYEPFAFSRSIHFSPKPFDVDRFVVFVLDFPI